MKKRWKDIRNAFVMFCVMVAMLSTATYAWFTLTDSPTVTSLQMTAATKGGLKISKTVGGPWESAIDLSDKTTVDGKPFKLIPVSPSGAGFSEPVYTGSNVTALNSKVLTTDDELKGVVAKYEYYLKADDGTVGVGIIAGDPGQTGTMGVTGGVANLAGSLVRQRTGQDGDTATMNAERAIRIGFVVDGTSDMIIYEPNNGTGNTGTKAGNSVTGPTSKVISNASGQITTGGSGNTSVKLFEVSDAGKKVTMYIWIEGTDDDCVDQIQTDGIEAQIQFTVVDGGTTP